jgi:hypothetical protein
MPPTIDELRDRQKRIEDALQLTSAAVFVQTIAGWPEKDLLILLNNLTRRWQPGGRSYRARFNAIEKELEKISGGKVNIPDVYR